MCSDGLEKHVIIVLMHIVSKSGNISHSQTTSCSEEERIAVSECIETL